MINIGKEEIVKLLETEEILLVNKPKGITSFDCIRILQRTYKDKTGNRIKIGHAGTLDPNATGLMLLGIRSGTKKLSELILNNKTYKATIQFGIKNETGDIDGKVLEEWDEKILKHFFIQNNIDENKIKNVVNSLIGEAEYVVPTFSAIKINGKKMYEIARKNNSNQKKTLDIKRKMAVHKIENIKYEFPFLHCTLTVSKGTYIRSLSNKIGEILNIPVTLSDLYRIEIGQYKIEKAINLPQENIEQILKIKQARRNTEK